MMTKEQMIERYEELYHKMETSKEPKYMVIFGESEKYMFKEIAKMNPSMAENWLSHLEAVCWDSYLSETEAKNIGMRIVNQDGTKGFHWDYNTFTKAVESLGGVVEEKPYYNSYSLWVTANNIYADMALSISSDLGYKTPSEVPNDKMAFSCYMKAVELLKDIDDGYKIRKYFKEKMYDNYK